MRLINTRTLELEEFFDTEIPRYAILSHTWSVEEVTFQDMKTRARERKKGFQKILKCCELAQAKGIKYAWVDTCCIDKTSSSELTEAINSMYRWYEASEVCYAYLEDFESTIAAITNSIIDEHPFDEHPFGQCRWFKRGWTLQELIAPRQLIFFDKYWRASGTRAYFSSTLQDVTGIAETVLLYTRGGPKSYSVAARMSWASNRSTTRVEDTAYCLMGLFDVNMPLLYGEGSKAYTRLQEEIMKQSEDYTIFAWKYSDSQTFLDYCRKSGITRGKENPACTSPLAVHPSAFAGSSLFTTAGSLLELKPEDRTFYVNNRGLLLNTASVRSRRYPYLIALLPILSFTHGHLDPYSRVGFYITLTGHTGHYTRVLNTQLVNVSTGVSGSLRLLLFARVFRCLELLPAFGPGDISSYKEWRSSIQLGNAIQWPYRSEPYEGRKTYTFEACRDSIAGSLMCAVIGPGAFVLTFAIDSQLNVRHTIAYFSRYIFPEQPIPIDWFMLPKRETEPWYGLLLACLAVSNDALDDYFQAFFSCPERLRSAEAARYRFKVALPENFDARAREFTFAPSDFGSPPPQKWPDIVFVSPVRRVTPDTFTLPEQALE